MPIYEYTCSSCGAEQEMISHFDDPNPICANCGKEMQKKISLSSFHLKGTGWYVSDYKNNKSKETKKEKQTTSGESTSSGIPTDL